MKGRTGNNAPMSYPIERKKTMNKKAIWKKALALSLVVLMLAVSLVACNGGNGGTTIDATWKQNDENGVIYFSRVLAQCDDAHDAKEMFIAASRGYDMSAEGFDDANLVLAADAVTITVNDIQYTVSVAGAKAAVEKIKPTDDLSIARYNEFRDALTAEQVVEIVNRVKAEKAVDLAPTSGFSKVLVWIGVFLRWLTNLTAGNYVIALFFFALIVELLMLPFGIKQQKNSQKQAKLRPKEMAIRKKYAGRNDQVSQRKLQEEIQRLYQEEGFNPMSGCLPLLIQMPIILALYNLVIDPMKYVLGLAPGLTGALTTYGTTARAAGGLGMTIAANSRGSIELLSRLNAENLAGLREFAFFNNAGACADALSNITVPNFNLFGLNMGIIPSITDPSWLWLIPVLTFAVYFASSKLMRKFSYQPAVQDQQMGCSNNMMDIGMPLMSVYITFIVPAAVGVYWIFKSIISTLTRFITNKIMPLPVCTEEDIKAAERELKGKNKPEKRPAGSRTTSDGRVIRSLHHIDDEDELPPRTTEPVGRYDRDDEETPAAPAAPAETKDASAAGSVAPAPLKEDRKNDKKK